MIDTPVASATALKRGWSRRGKLHREPASANIMSKLLAKQHLNIRFVINHENEKVHDRPPDLATVAAVRGRVILNSVNSPGWVSTSIDPPCCLTMTS